jgi:hypothetical protein
MTVVTMKDFVPPAREDGLPWTTIRIEEASTSAGTWTQIDSQVLTPLDPDPRYPMARDWTTTMATLLPGVGYYRVRFADAASRTSEYSDAVLNAPVTWVPDLREVAVHIRSRTVERNTNNFAGTFTDATRPSESDAWEALVLAQDDVIADTGALDPTWLSPEGAKAVRSLIALRAAMIIERSYYPEQVGTNKSPYTALERDWDKRLPAVVAAIAEDKAGAIIPGGVDSGSGTVVTPAIDRDVYVPASARLYSHLGAWIGSGSGQYTFPDEAPGGTISGDTKF